MTVRKARLCVPAVILLGAALLSLPGTSAAAPRAAGPGDTVDARARLLAPGAKEQRLAVKQAREAVRSANASLAPSDVSVVGDQKLWLALDDANGELYVKLYTLRGIGDNIEVWVASDADETSTATDFPDGDCRNGVRTQITDDQVT